MCGTVAWLQQCRDDEQFDLAAWFHKHSAHHLFEWWAFFYLWRLASFMASGVPKVRRRSRSGDGSLIYCYSLNNPVTDARYSGQLPESSSLIA
jgi:hypothetical protein